MSLPIAGKVLDLGDVSFLSLDSVNISTRCKRLTAMTLFLSSAVLRILLVVLVLLWVAEKVC